MTNVHTLQSDSKTHVHTLQQFDKFFKKNCQICVIVIFNNVNTVRSKMWVLVFPHHSCQKLIKSLVFDSWFDKIFWDLWCGKSHTHISSSQYSLTTVQKIWMGKTTTIQEFWLTIKKWEVVEWVLYSIFLSHTDEFCKDATRVCGYEKIKTNYFSDTLEQLSFTDIVKKIQPHTFIPMLEIF